MVISICTVKIWNPPFGVDSYFNHNHCITCTSCPVRSRQSITTNRDKYCQYNRFKEQDQQPGSQTHFLSSVLRCGGLFPWLHNCCCPCPMLARLRHINCETCVNHNNTMVDFLRAATSGGTLHLYLIRKMLPNHPPLFETFSHLHQHTPP